MATEHSWAQANKCHSVLEDALGFEQPSYAVTAVVFEHGENPVPFGDRTTYLHNTSC